MAHDKLYGICQNKCLVEVSPKTETDATKTAVENTVRLTGKQEISGEKTFNGNLNKNVNGNGKILTINDSTSFEQGENYHDIVLNKEDISPTFIRFRSGDENRGRSSTIELNARNSTGGVGGKLILKWDATTNKATSTAPNPLTNSVNDEIMTAGALNSWNTVVHTTGNETIAGNKTFSNNITVNNNIPSIDLKTTKASISSPASTNSDILLNFIDSSDQKPFTILNSIETGGNVRTYLRNRCRNENDTANVESTVTIVSNKNGSTYATAPHTPLNANGNEIATAGWVNDRIEAVVPVTKHSMSINSLTDLRNALTIMRDGAIGTINFKFKPKISGSIESIGYVSVMGRDSTSTVCDFFVKGGIAQHHMPSSEIQGYTKLVMGNINLLLWCDNDFDDPITLDNGYYYTGFYDYIG